MLSTILFDVVFNLLLDFIKSSGISGYKFKNVRVNSLQKAYADDLTILTNRVDAHQHVLTLIDNFLLWTRKMKAKPRKCRSLAMKYFTQKLKQEFTPHNDHTFAPFDPKLTLGGSPIQFIGDEPFRFLGRFQGYDASTTEKIGQQKIREQFKNHLETVDRMVS